MISLPTIRGGWKVVYADPAWKYGNSATRSSAAGEYKCMKTEEIQMLPVADIVAKDAMLFLWVTPPFLREGFEVMRSWGFEYKTIAFWWGKRNSKTNSPFFGMGNYTRANGEPCLIGIRGKPKRFSAAVQQFYWGPRGAHSEKPAEIRRRIETLAGDVPRLEMFSRVDVKGWQRWGNEFL